MLEIRLSTSLRDQIERSEDRQSLQKFQYKTPEMANFTVRATLYCHKLKSFMKLTIYIYIKVIQVHDGFFTCVLFCHDSSIFLEKQQKMMSPLPFYQASTTWQKRRNHFHLLPAKICTSNCYMIFSYIFVIGIYRNMLNISIFGFIIIIFIIDVHCNKNSLQTLVGSLQWNEVFKTSFRPENY